MAKRTTVKAVALGYRDVGTSGDYTPLMGVLKGLAVAQDEPDSTEIEAEFYDSPFDIFYDGNPVTMTFELANYDLAELEDLFGGAYDDTNDEYEAASNAFTSEHEWKLDFGRGNASLVIYKGLTIGTLKKDADGALNYSVTITALIYNDGENDHMYKIVGSSGDTPSPTPSLLTNLSFVTSQSETYASDEQVATGKRNGETIVPVIFYEDNNYLVLLTKGWRQEGTLTCWGDTIVNTSIEAIIDDIVPGASPLVIRIEHYDNQPDQEEIHLLLNQFVAGSYTPTQLAYYGSIRGDSGNYAFDSAQFIIVKQSDNAEHGFYVLSRTLDGTWVVEEASSQLADKIRQIGYYEVDSMEPEVSFEFNVHGGSNYSYNQEDGVISPNIARL